MIQRHLTRFFLASLCWGLSACNSEDAGAPINGRLISHIEIELKGERSVDEERLRNMMISKVGDEISTEALDSDIKSLYESGRVDDVHLFAENDGDSVKLIVEISTRRPFGPPFCSGNTAYSSIALAEASGLTDEQPVTLEALEKARLKLKAFYVSQGYDDADVVCRAFKGGEPRPDDFIYVIEEGSTLPQASTNHLP